jgi:hypothetical protein
MVHVVHFVVQKISYVMEVMKLGLSNNQIAEELNVEENTARRMCNLMRGSMFFQNCLRKLSGTVEIDEAYQTAGSKGNGKNTQQGNKSKGIKKDLGENVD